MSASPPGVQARGAQAQDAIIDFLSQGAAYGLPGAPVERIETHCSLVFLVDDRAYKLKRPIRYASLDYTTQARRRAACAAELALNRRTAPDLYLGLAAVTRDAAGRLALDGAGEPVEHLVVMRRFGQSDLFDALLDRGELTPALMRRLGKRIARLHQQAEARPERGGSAALRGVIAENDRELARVAAALDGAAVDDLSRACHAALDRLAPLLDRRQSARKVRRGHGDLRLANISLFHGEPTPFDCIEFSEEVGCTDVLYDLAFLLMDLEARDRRDLGNAVFNAYLDVAPETDGLRALPLFLALRAATRAYAVAGSAQRRDDPRLLDFARHHIAVGLGLLSAAPPRLMLLGGGSAGARRTEAERLAPGFRPAPGARLLALRQDVWAEAEAVLEAGVSVLIEGDFAAAADLAAAAALTARHPDAACAWWLGTGPPAGALAWQAQA